MYAIYVTDQGTR